MGKPPPLIFLFELIHTGILLESVRRFKASGLNSFYGFPVDLLRSIYFLVKMKRYLDSSVFVPKVFPA
jgi:hypothetical protein